MPTQPMPPAWEPMSCGLLVEFPLYVLLHPEKKGKKTTQHGYNMAHFGLPAAFFLSASLLGTHLWPRVFNKARTTGK